MATRYRINKAQVRDLEDLLDRLSPAGLANRPNLEAYLDAAVRPVLARVIAFAKGDTGTCARCGATDVRVHTHTQFCGACGCPKCGTRECAGTCP